MKRFTLLVDERESSTMNYGVSLHQAESQEECRQAFDLVREETIEAFSLCFGHYKTKRFRNARLVENLGTADERVVSRYHNDWLQL